MRDFDNRIKIITYRC